MGELGNMGSNALAMCYKQLTTLGLRFFATRPEVGVAQHFPDRHPGGFEAPEKLDPYQDSRGVIPLAGGVTCGKGQ